MPKPKKQHGAPPKKSRKMNTFAKLSTTSGKTKPGGGDGAKTSQNGKKNQGRNQTKQQQKRKPIVPFARGDRILLIGEGELSSVHHT
jgi:25S rRNA (uracil2634-N3)-methyltransferase